MTTMLARGVRRLRDRRNRYSFRRKLREAWRFGGLTPWQLGRRLYALALDAEILNRAAEVSYYAILAVVPFLIMFVSFIQIFLAATHLGGTGVSGREASAKTIHNTLDQTFKPLLPEAAYKEFVEQQLPDIAKQVRPGISALISVSFLVMIWAASNLFASIIASLNACYGVRESRPYWKWRSMAVLLTLVEAVLVVLALVLVVAEPQISDFLSDRLNLGHVRLMVQVAQWVAVLVLMTLSLGMTYSFAPNVKQEWPWITPGTVLGSLLWIGISLVFRVYVQNFSHYTQYYGTLTGVVVLLIWLYLVSVVVLAGGALNSIIEQASPLGKDRGQRISPFSTPPQETMSIR